MSRLALSTALVAALSIAASAEAGNKKRHAFNLSNLSGSQITLPGGPGFKVPCLKPPVHPPVHPPIHPPVVCPKPPIVLPPPPVVVCPPKPPVVTPPVILPPPVVCEKPPVVCPPTHVGYRFGMSLQRVQTAYGIGLQVVSVELHGPASLAGLRPGQVLLAANGQSLSHAASNEHGVALLQAAVTASQPVATAAPVLTLVSTGGPQGVPTVALTVLDPIGNQMTLVTVTPQIAGGAAPAASAPIALNPGQPTAAL